MPGIMSQMPPLLVSIDEDVANTLLPCAARVTYSLYLLYVQSYLKFTPSIEDFSADQTVVA